jgi:hypothetical protein
MLEFKSQRTAPARELPAGIPSGAVGLWIIAGLKISFFHSNIRMFPQVRGLYAGKKISIHSFSHRAVHKQQRLVHTLSTEVQNSGLCESAAGR